MEEKKSNKKKITTIISVIAAIIVIVLGVLSANEYKQKEIIGKEMESINQSGEVNQEIKSKGKYAEVEKALKDYVTEYQGIAKDMVNEYQNEKFTTILSADNYKNDGPNFEESKKLVSDVKAKGEETKTKLGEMVTDEYKEKRATDCNLSGKYKDLFKDSIKLESELKDVNSTIDNVNNYLDKIDEIFDFLKENQGKWQIRNDKVEFSDMSQLTKYNSLIISVNTAASKLK